MVKCSSCVDDAVTETTNQSFALPQQASSVLNAESAGDSKSASVQLPLNDKFGLAYTCGKCGTRNAISVGRIAWNNGVVVATCRGCGARHLLADNSGLLDLDNDTAFTNIVQLIESQGDTVTKINRLDDDTLSALNLTVGEDGKLKLSDEELAATGTSLNTDSGDDSMDPPDRTNLEVATAAAAAAAPPTSATAKSPGMAQSADEEVDAAPLIIQLTEGIQQGDVLTVESEFGMLHVPVPRGSPQRCRLEVQGMVEVGLGAGYNRWVQASGEGQWEQSEAWKVGDIVAVNMPEGEVVRIKIPESATEDATLRIAYPVVVKPGP